MSTIKLNGSSSGNAQVTVAAAAGTPTITLPTASIDLSSAGSDGQFLKTNGSGTLSFASVDKIEEGNTNVECVDSGSDGHILFDTDGQERARINNDGLFVMGRTDQQSTSSRMSLQGVSVHPLEIKRGGTGDQGMIGFYNDNGMVGSIETNGSATEFNTSSDYRMKENVTALTNAVTRLKTLKPYRFNFKADASKTVDGFLAHEVTAVPEAISGEKDAVVTQAKIDSGIYKQSQLNDPIYQGIDQSKLVPLLVAALQEAVARIETLEAK